MTYLITKSIKNSDILNYEGYSYTKKKATAFGIIWRCINRQCRVILQTSHNYSTFALANLYINGTHSIHNPDYRLIMKVQKINEMKSKIGTNNLNTDEIIYMVLENCFPENAMHVGKVDSLKRMLRYEQQRLLKPQPYFNIHLQLSRELCFSRKNEAFLRYCIGIENENNVDENFIIFFTDSAANKLRENRVWCVDGTFTTIASPYLQLWTISYIINHNVFPAIYCFMKNKRQTSYQSLFRKIRELIPDLNPEFIKIDFEIAAINELNSEFLEAIISSCTFYLGQSIQRNMQNNSLTSLYRENPIIRK